MKRSQDSDVGMQSYVELLETHEKQLQAIKELNASHASTTEALRGMAKEIILENMELFVPFNDRFVKQLGTIVDFDCDRACMLLDLKDDSHVFVVEYTVDYCSNVDVLWVSTADKKETCVSDILARVVRRNAHQIYLDGESRVLEEECDVDKCPCHVEGSKYQWLLKFLSANTLCVAALASELFKAHREFTTDPQKAYARIRQEEAGNNKKAKLDEEEEK